VEQRAVPRSQGPIWCFHDHFEGQGRWNAIDFQWTEIQDPDHDSRRKEGKQQQIYGKTLIELLFYPNVGGKESSMG